MKKLKYLGFKNELKLEQYLEQFLLNKRMSLNDIVRIVEEELRIDKFYLAPTTWHEIMGIDKSFIGKIFHENDWYAFDIEIYYLETFTHDINGQKIILITEIAVLEN